MEAITPERMGEVERRSEELGVPRILLMENAGQAVARHIRDKFGDLGGKKVVVVAGTGNNGGDGFVAARHLAYHKAEVLVALLGEPGDIRTEEALSNWKVLENMRRSVKLMVVKDEGALEALRLHIAGADVIVDAIFGTGLKGRIREPQSTAIDLINASEAYKVAVDIPSGLDPLSGEVRDKAVKADATITFHKAKQGLLSRPDCAGEIIVEPIGVPPEAEV